MIRIEAKQVLEKTHQESRARAEAFRSKHGRLPHLAMVLIGENPASVIYTRKKGETAATVGIAHETITLPKNCSAEEAKAVIDRLNLDPRVDGILLQRPVPETFREEEVLYWISPEKDVDAFHPENAGKLFLGLPCFQPCTPSGIMALLKFYGITAAGKSACVIGRSSIVGKPMAALLLRADATVIQCHSRTRDLAHFTKQADILVAAAGKAKLINAQHVKEGAVVIDVGIHRDSAGKICGDVDFDSVAPHVSAITPVPGGVGPMTIATLIQNTIWSAELRSGH